MTEQPEITVVDSQSIFSKYNSSGCLDAYIDQLLSENIRQNLVSRETSRSDLVRLIAESLFPLEFLNLPIDRYLDVGAGGGLPGIPIIMALKPDQAVLVERSDRKGGALNRMAHHLGLSTTIFREEFQRFSADCKFDLISIRLVALTSEILDQATALLADNGQLVYYARSEFNSPGVTCDVHNYRMDNRPDIKQFSVFKLTTK